MGAFTPYYLKNESLLFDRNVELTRHQFLDGRDGEVRFHLQVDLLAGDEFNRHDHDAEIGRSTIGEYRFKYVLIFNQVCETQMFSSLIRDYELLSSSAHIPVGVIKNNPLVGLFVDCVNES